MAARFSFRQNPNSRRLPLLKSGEEGVKRKTSVSQQGAMRSYAQYSGIAIQMIVTLLAAMYGGQWLDRRFDTAPTFVTICLLLGLVLALWLPLRTLLKK